MKHHRRRRRNFIFFLHGWLLHTHTHTQNNKKAEFRFFYVCHDSERYRYVVSLCKKWSRVKLEAGFLIFTVYELKSSTGTTTKTSSQKIFAPKKIIRLFLHFSYTSHTESGFRKHNMIGFYEFYDYRLSQTIKTE